MVLTADDFLGQLIDTLGQQAIGPDIRGHLSIIRCIRDDAILIGNDGCDRIPQLTCQLLLGLCIIRFYPSEYYFDPVFIILPVLEDFQCPFRMLNLLGFIDHAH